MSANTDDAIKLIKHLAPAVIFQKLISHRLLGSFLFTLATFICLECNGKECITIFVCQWVVLRPAPFLNHLVPHSNGLQGNS